MLLVYRPSDLPDAAAFARDLRAALAVAGVPELELLGMWSFDRLDPYSIGFDGAVQFSPLQVPTPNLAEEPLLEVQCEPHEAPMIYAYAEAIRHGLAEAEQPHPFPLYSGLCPSWDNTARRGCNSVSWIGATPGRFERWLRLARWRTQAAYTRGELRAPALFINAWNEWGEGCHLEPDTYWGYRWLEGALRAIDVCPKYDSGVDILFIGHDAFNAGAQRSLLTLISDVRSRYPSLQLAVLLLGGGMLLHSYRALCPSRCIDLQLLGDCTLDPSQSGLWSILPRDAGAVVVNSTASLPGLEALSVISGDRCWHEYLLVHEFPVETMRRGLMPSLETALMSLKGIVVPSPMARSMWMDIFSPLTSSPGLFWCLPPEDSPDLVLSVIQDAPLEEWASWNGLRLLGFGHDFQSFQRFSLAVLGMIARGASVRGLWVGSAGIGDDNIAIQSGVDVSAAVEAASVLVVVKSGETFGLVVKEALARGCPVVVGRSLPLGIASWWKSGQLPGLYVVDDTAVCDQLEKFVFESPVWRRCRQEGVANFLRSLHQERLCGLDRLVWAILEPNVDHRA